ncbi:MAG: ANTAR domain-containing protein [Actinomycetota bacterium]|nr:ANTAR domain-containing protein [Actinomycetota bacterium]
MTRPVLLIDANPQSRRMLASSFARLGVPLQTYPSIDSIADTQTLFDLVAIGPGSSEDKSVVNLVRRVDASVCMPILMIGTIPVDEGIRTALTLGADDYLAFPLKSDVLRARTESLLAARARSEFALVRASERAAHLELALATNRSIGIALGILMATQKVTSEEAFSRLKAVSQRSNRKLRAIADDVIYTGALTESG